MPRHKAGKRRYRVDGNDSQSQNFKNTVSASTSASYRSAACSRTFEDSRGYRERRRSNYKRDGFSDYNAAGEQLRNSSANSNCGNELEIPGFYYDTEKKRYFKIAPNHASSTCNYTRDSIAKQQAEKKRQSDIADIFQNDIKAVLKGKEIRKCISHNLTSLIQDRQVMGHTKPFLRSKIFEKCVSHLKPVGSQNIFNPPLLDHYENLEHVQVMHLGEDHNEILCLWNIRDTWVQRIQRIQICETERTEKQSSLSVIAMPKLQAILPMLNKVTDLCWAPVSDGQTHVLYTTMCHMGHQESLAQIKSLNPEDSSPGQNYNLGKKATWTCAWNKAKCQFCVGSEKCALLLNVERRTMWEYNTNKSDPLSLTFSNYSGNSLHVGTRKGQILTFDRRSMSTFPVVTLNHHSSVCSVKELENDNFLLASDFTGKICLWDIRMKKVFVQYSGNVNQYSRLPLHVDELQKILYTVGEDGYTRFWSLDQGRQIYMIPPPCSVSRETIPCVKLSSRWGNRDGNMGLVMGLKNKFYFYGTLPLT